ncbi:Uncharacterized protein OnM2_052010 [Erysiphe neolycopersici]|uniref:Uncharacterized protein n=1 Tax=Erysiphe neolycopersici TaxID=212602 RepID=A0A420HS49_9PEZI|nr:Uncharacterized protein OnM2_052010 [Erysiphe neolycopersici]
MEEDLLYSLDYKAWLIWLEDQPSQQQSQIAQKLYKKILDILLSSLDASEGVCMKFCHFIEQCSGSKSLQIREFAFSDKICLEIYSFFLEFNEKNKNRCMRRVLDLVSTLIACNPSRIIVNNIKKTILDRSISIICYKSSKPLIKPAVKSLEYFLSNGTVSIHELVEAFETISRDRSKKFSPINDNKISWIDLFFEKIFELLTYSEISPIAGKFLVAIFRQTRDCTQKPFQNEVQITPWQVWIVKAIENKPGIIEDIKNYILPPLFNLDRQNSLDFLEDLNKQDIGNQLQSRAIEPQIILKLVAFEIGKKTGLIDEEAQFEFYRVPNKLPKAIIIKESLIDGFLAHADDLVRSISFSILVSSSTPLRPFSPTTIRIIKSKLHILFSDTDIKFRNEILSTTKQLIERLRGSSAFLVKEINSIKFQLHNGNRSDVMQVAQAENLLRKTMDLLQSQRSFIEWMLEFLIGELIPTASYQRHITSLKAINIWLSSGITESKSRKPSAKKTTSQTIWPFTIDFFIPETLKLLIDLLVDPFEDVRALASNILKMASTFQFHRSAESSIPENKIWKHIFIPEVCYWSSNFQDDLSKRSIEEKQINIGGSLKILENFIECIEEISNKTGRADYADGLARSYELYYYLQDSPKERNKIFRNLADKLVMKISLAENNLVKAVQDEPLHGILAALNLIWENSTVDLLDLNNQTSGINQMLDFQNNCVHFCSRIWTVVKPILCNDSPEGLLLEDLEEPETVDTKDILSYSFRAIHESSNLLRTLMRKSQSCSTKHSQPFIHIFTDIGNLSFEKLSCLRHRGAFSTVSLTFAASCKIADTCQSNTLKIWLERAFICLQTQVSTTRRSAGIPSIITGIMSAISRSDFENTIKKLLEIARNEINSELDQEQLPQVHALNSLKDIVKSVTTNTKVGLYISECLEVVGMCLNSSAWAIRNSALILLRSIIDNLIGTSSKSDESDTNWDGSSTKIQYEKYAALPRILMQLLQYENKELYSQNKNHTVLPALSIIRRAGIPLEYRNEFQKIVSNLLGSREWHLREQGARTIMVHQDQMTELEAVKRLIENSGNTTNHQHGSILAAKLIMLERVDVSKYELDKLSDVVHLILSQQHYTYNPFIQNEYIELANAAFIHILRHSDLTTMNQRQNYIFRLLEKTRTLHYSSDLLTKAPTVSSHSSSEPPIYSQAKLRQKIITTIVLSDELSISETMEQALAQGSDTIISVVNCVLPILKYNASENVLNCILLSFAKILENTKDSDVVCTIIDIVPQIIESNDVLFQTGNKPAQHLIEKLESFIALTTNKSPRLLISYYKFSGLILLYKLSSPVLLDDQKKSAICHWIENMKRACQENQDFEIRYAVTVAIQKFYQYYRRGHVDLVTDCHLLELNFILMTLLVDDDDEIRKLAAFISSDINDRSLCPLAALDTLFKHQVTNYYLSKNFGWHCIHNLLVFHDTNSKNDPMDPDNMLRLAFTHDYSLFAVEEPNLFSDPCRTQDYFARAFLQLPFSPEIQLKLHNSGIRSEFYTLLEWASKGFKALQKQYTNQQNFIKQYSPTSASIFIAIRRIIVCGNISLAYWQKNSDGFFRMKKLAATTTTTDAESSLIISWESLIEEIKQQLDIITCQIHIHASLRRLAAKQLLDYQTI